MSIRHFCDYAHQRRCWRDKYTDYTLRCGESTAPYKMNSMNVRCRGDALIGPQMFISAAYITS